MNIPGTSTSFASGGGDSSANNAKTFLLPDKCFEKRIACTWRSGNKFIVYPRSQKQDKSPGEVLDNKIVNIRQEIMLFTPILRKLVNESNGTFITLQKIVEDSQNADHQVEFLKISRQYRSIVRVCIENLQEAAEIETDSLEKNILLSYITIFYTVECIWHLCEILFIDSIPGDVVLPYLLEWVRFHFPCHEQTAAQLLESCEKGSEENPEYWDTVIGMVIQGRVDVARALLKLHSLSESNEFKLVDNSLRSMPVYSVYGGISSGEFTITWKHWQAECRSKLSSRTLGSQPYLELIIKLVIGDYATFESIRDKYDSWFDLLGGWVMFTAPWAKRHELSAAASACAGMRHAVDKHTELNMLVRALIEGDLHQVIHQIQQMSDNGWFATHLTDLLYHCGKLKVIDSHTVHTTDRLRESLILEYGSLLMEHPSLWTVALSYLCACPPEGVRRAELMLERIPLRTEGKAMSLIAEAKKYELDGVVKTISTCMGAHHLSNERIGSALAWAIRGKNSSLASRVADRALRNYCDTGVIPAVDVLTTIGSNMLLTDRLLFACKYCEFHRLYKSREFKLAAKLLVSLLTSKITPEYFWETLLLDTLPLLESDEPLFSSDATCDIMALLELRGSSLSNEKADLLRLALVRNLAKAVLEPMDDD